MEGSCLAPGLVQQAPARDVWGLSEPELCLLRVRATRRSRKRVV